MKGPTSRQKAVVVSLAVASALSSFGCNLKPEPEKNCQEKSGAMVECPPAIAILQKEIDCVEQDGSIRYRSGKKIAPNPKPSLAGIKTEVIDVVGSNGLYSIELEIPAGVKGRAKAFPCNAK